MKILIRCNAGNKYGLGHLVRCITLAKIFEEKGHSVFFIIKTDNKLITNSFLRGEGVLENKYIFLDDSLTKNDDLLTIITHYKNGFSFLIIDHYDYDLHYQTKIFEENIKWALFDYRAENLILANVVINGNISAKEEMYKSITQEGTSLCVGYEYAILRTEFINQSANPGKNKILIALGGGRYTDEIIEMIHSVVEDYNYSYEIVSNDERLSERFISIKNVSIHINLIDVLSVYKKCDTAIVAGGVTTFELAALNIPMMIVPYARNHELNAIAFEQNNFGINYRNPFNFIAIAKKQGLERLLIDVHEAFKKRKIIFDGLGATRIVEQIIDLK